VIERESRQKVNIMHLKEREREFGGVIGGGGREEDWGRPGGCGLNKRGERVRNLDIENERRREKVSC